MIRVESTGTVVLEIALTATETSPGTSTTFGQAALEVRRGGALVHALVLQVGKIYSVGRQSSSTIALVGKRVSRSHASLEVCAGGLQVVDLRSSNGVRVDGLAIPPEQPVRVTPGQEIGIGDYQIEFQLLGVSEREDDAAQRFAELLDALPHDFELLGQLGAGSNGTLWAALDRRNHRRVAIKVLNTICDPESELAQCFLREATLCQRVTSPHVVEVYDVQLLLDQPVIFMELVNGPSALERLEACGPRMSILEALKIGEDVARGLVAVSAAGVVHRDVKPSNILLGPSGAKLSDFGIAKHLGGPSITASGLGMGTIAYVAPEQLVNAKHVDSQADVYGLGATLYKLLTGVAPFDPARPMVELFSLILNTAPPPIRQKRSDLSEDAASLVDQMLAKLPEDRPTPIWGIVAELSRLRKSLKGFQPDETQDLETFR